MHQGYKAIGRIIKGGWDAGLIWVGNMPQEKDKQWLNKWGNIHKNIFDHLRNLFLCVTLAYGGLLIIQKSELLMFYPVINKYLGLLVLIIAALLLIANMIHGLTVIIFEIRRILFVALFFAFYFFFTGATISLFIALVNAAIEKNAS